MVKQYSRRRDTPRLHYIKTSLGEEIDADVSDGYDDDDDDDDDYDDVDDDFPKYRYDSEAICFGGIEGRGVVEGPSEGLKTSLQYRVKYLTRLRRESIWTGSL